MLDLVVFLNNDLYVNDNDEVLDEIDVESVRWFNFVIKIVLVS